MLKKHLSEILMYYNFIDDLCIIDTEGIIVFNQTFIKGAYTFPIENTIGEHLSVVYPSEPGESSMLKVLETEIPIMNQETSWTTYLGDSHTGVVNTLPIYENDVLVGVIEIARFTDNDNPVNSIRLHTQENSSSVYTLDNIITANTEMNQLKEKVLKLSKYNCNIMLQGETGTGKELFAQSIHSSSFMHNGPFVSQNCSALPDSLAEAILFGTEKGGFTGAENKKGLFELADGGTLFLDELNSMSLSTQGKILKALEDKKITRVGGETPIPVNVRIISALNCDPMKAISQGTLRSDLFYRLGTVILVIPPLRDRDDDIEFLADYFFNYFKISLNANTEGLSDELIEFLKEYNWPGNVRELRNVIQSCIIMSDEKIIGKDSLPAYITNGDKIADNSEVGTTLTDKVCRYEKELIIDALNHSKNKSKAAELLGISKQLLNSKITKYNII